MEIADNEPPQYSAQIATAMSLEKVRNSHRNDHHNTARNKPPQLIGIRCATATAMTTKLQRANSYRKYQRESPPQMPPQMATAHTTANGHHNRHRNGSRGTARLPLLWRQCIVTPTRPQGWVTTLARFGVMISFGAQNCESLKFPKTCKSLSNKTAK